MIMYTNTYNLKIVPIFTTGVLGSIGEWESSVIESKKQKERVY